MSPSNEKDRLLDFTLSLGGELTVRLMTPGEVVTVTAWVQPDSVSETRRPATADEMRFRGELNIVFQRELGRREREQRLARESIPPIPRETP